jgi:hypothetical protein
MRTAPFRSGCVIAGLIALLASPVAEAQGVAASDGTHTVKRGDTLWDLARTYLGDPFMWPEIYRINTTVVEDPHWIFPGEVLQIPGRQVAQTPPAALDDGAPEMSSAPETAADAPQVTQVAAERPPAPQSATIFASSPFVRRSAETTRRASGVEPQPAVRPGDFYGAPWVDRRGGPRDAGRIIAPADIAGIGDTRDIAWVYVYDRLYVALPGGSIAAIGDRYMTFRLGAELPNGQQVIIPTGVVRVIATADGDAPTVRLIQQFENVQVDDRIMRLDRVTLPLRSAYMPVDLGMEGRITWIPSEVVLPSLQRYVVLDLTSLDGVRLGDLFTVFRPVHRFNGHTLPEEEIASVQIVRVNERGATGLVVDQRHPAITQGASVRLTARMP